MILGQNQSHQTYFYRKEGQFKRIKLDEIIFLEAADNYVKFFAPEFCYILRTTLTTALSQLPGRKFIQIHRSVAVAVDQIETIGKDYLTLLSVTHKAFPVSKTYYGMLVDRITIIDGGHGNNISLVKYDTP
jgi:DNA-binding LytR/AlgR family response regulator